MSRKREPDRTGFEEDSADYQSEAERVARWQQENAEAFKVLNQHLEKYGTTAERAKGLR